MKQKIYLTDDTWKRLTDMTKDHTGKDDVNTDDRKIFIKDEFNGTFKTTPDWGSIIFNDSSDYHRFMIFL